MPPIRWIAVAQCLVVELDDAIGPVSHPIGVRGIMSTLVINEVSLGFGSSWLHLIHAGADICKESGGDTGANRLVRWKSMRSYCLTLTYPKKILCSQLVRLHSLCLKKFQAQCPL
jgi:hypothetical protein